MNVLSPDFPTIRPLQRRDVDDLARAFSATDPRNKTVALFQRYWNESATGDRSVLVAILNDTPVGYLTVVWRSPYPPFRDAGIPEIVDFNVLPSHRRKGIGAVLMDAAENAIAERSPVAGIGVGLDPGYGDAHRLYVRRGYIPDGRGLYQNGKHAIYGDTVVVNDGLCLFFTKRLK